MSDTEKIARLKNALSGTTTTPPMDHFVDTNKVIGGNGQDGKSAGELIRSVKYLLEWMPVCSVGSSGHKRRVAVESALAKLGEDGSLKSAVGVKADLEHPGNDTGGEISGGEAGTGQDAQLKEALRSKFIGVQGQAIAKLEAELARLRDTQKDKQ